MEESILTVELFGENIEQFEATINNLLDGWLRVENGLKVMVTSFFFEDYGTIMIDYEDDKKSLDKIKDLTDKLLKGLKIENYNFL